MAYSLNGGATWTNWSNNATLTMVPGGQLEFRVKTNCRAAVGTITVINVSDSNLTLATVNYDVEVITC